MAKLAPDFRNKKTLQNWRRSIRVHAKSLRDRPIALLGTADIAVVLEPLRAKHETARVTHGRIETVLRHAGTAGLRSGENPASREALSMPRRKLNSIRHHPAMQPGYIEHGRDLQFGARFWAHVRVGLFREGSRPRKGTPVPGLDRAVFLAMALCTSVAILACPCSGRRSSASFPAGP